MSKVLFNRAPIVIDIELATKVGLHEAIILQQMHYWLELNKEKERNHIEDKYWTYNPISEWQKKFPFLSDHAVRKGLEHLRKEKLLLTGNFNKSRVDRTLWYTIDYKNLEKLMQVVVVQSIDESEEKESKNGEHATNASVENNKCKGQKTTNAPVENNTPIPENNTDINKKNIYIVQSEQLWKMYPNKKGKVDAFKKLPKLIETYGYEQLERCIARYMDELAIEQWKKAQNGSTFFNKGYADYLDDNYCDSKQDQKSKQEDKPKYDIPF